ncbi:MAG TPA: M28 family peptidase [Gemmatimonadaceae bacterium]|nr:M28 family peptidase [Gemmatimonadaceae bacterium]
MPSAVAQLFALVRPEYSGDRALTTVAFVEQRWRLPGNRGFDESIDHIAAQLRGAGYVDEKSATPTDRLTFRIEQRPMSNAAWEPLDASLTIVGSSVPILRFATNRNMMAINSSSTSADGVEAEVVNVGKGDAASLDRVQLAGKIAFGEMGVGRLSSEARKRGAIGVLAYALPAYTKPETHRTSIQFSSIGADSTAKTWGLLLSYDAREALQRALAAGPVRVRVMTRSRFSASTERTVIADVRGAEKPNERFVFSAHVQEPGANDNASGVGAQVEMARVAATLVRGSKVNPRRSVTFIWGNEIASTRRYLQDGDRAATVKWGVSLDMVGEDTEKTGGTFLIEKMPDPSAVWPRGEDKHTEWGGSPLTVDKLTPHFFNDYILNRCLDQAAVTGWVVRTNPFEGGSDHVPFLDAKKPGLLFWHFTDVFYHTDNDRLPNVSPKEMANVGVSALVSALTLASADGATARALVAELQQAALARLDKEAALSRAAVASGGDKAKERLILDTWTDWYRGAVRTAADIEVGGSSRETQQAIRAAESAVQNAGASRAAPFR